ncbi:MAG: RNA polymerase sigma-70 factor (ECF subfamily) [Planctomycetota bacterium]|jgi:RNA polymerase sigma-70 factor (ECF subfamily)
MTPPPPLPSAKFLLDHVSWIRELAKHLVADESYREDLVQETYVQALQQPPEDALRIRQWLATVMRNLVRQRARGEGGRRHREERNARPEGLDSTDELVERATLQSDLVKRVLELREPYRSALLMRYFEELSPREIARRLDLPVATVHSRLKRALAELRVQLDGEQDGNRGAWLALFIPLADSGNTSATVTTIGTLILNTKLVVGLLAAVAVGTALSMDRSEEAVASVPTPLAVLPLAKDTTPQPESKFALQPNSVSREAVEPIAPASSANEIEPTEPEVVVPNLISGQVLDAFGSPLTGIAVRVDGRNQVTNSGMEGRFSIQTSEVECRLMAASADWVTVHEGYYRKDSFDPVLVVAPSVVLGGEVISGAGRPLAGALVRFTLPEGFNTRFSGILDSTRTIAWRTQTDEDGKFELLDVPAVEGSALAALLDGYQRSELASPIQTERGLLLTLQRPTKPTEGALSGRVVDQLGEPVEGARVATGLATVVSGDDGLFHLSLNRAVTPTAVAAVKSGFLPARMERPFSADSENGGWPDFVELELGGPALTLRGRVATKDGSPVSDARVWLGDTDHFGTIGLMPTSFENLMGGATIPPGTMESEKILPEVDGDNYWGHATSGMPSNAAWYWKLTDENGEFEFGGLFDHGYRVHVLDVDSLNEFESDYLNPGAGVKRIEAPDALLFPEVAGVVVDHLDRPIRGVRVSLHCEPFEESSRVFGGTSRITMNVNRETTRTDEQGRFAFKDVPMSGIRMNFLSDEIVPGQAWLKDFESNPTTIKMTVDARCHVSIELEPGNLSNEFGFRDADGEQLSVHRIPPHRPDRDQRLLGIVKNFISAGVAVLNGRSLCGTTRTRRQFRAAIRA